MSAWNQSCHPVLLPASWQIRVLHHPSDNERWDLGAWEGVGTTSSSLHPYHHCLSAQADR